EADVPFEALRDPYGITFWPTFKGRDGCRTPMPWKDAPDAGFSPAQPWLPVPDEHRARAVEHQEADPGSVLHAFRAFMRWRRQHPALVRGSIRFLDTAEPVLAFVREHEGQRVLAAFNLSANAATLSLPEGQWQPQAIPGYAAAGLEGGQATLPGWGVLFALAGCLPPSSRSGPGHHGCPGFFMPVGVRAWAGRPGDPFAARQARHIRSLPPPPGVIAPGCGMAFSVPRKVTRSTAVQTSPGPLPWSADPSHPFHRPGR